MQLIPYLLFEGDCKQAFEFYANVLRGKNTHMMTNGESPMAAHFPPEIHHRIMHARLVAETATLMGSDLPPGVKKPSVTPFAVSIIVSDTGEAERIFRALADGGSVEMPINETPWSERFGMCTDRFGTPWMINGNLHY